CVFQLCSRATVGLRNHDNSSACSSQNRSESLIERVHISMYCESELMCARCWMFTGGGNCRFSCIRESRLRDGSCDMDWNLPLKRTGVPPVNQPSPECILGAETRQGAPL